MILERRRSSFRFNFDFESKVDDLWCQCLFTLTNWNLDKGLKKDQLRKYMQQKEGGLWNRFMCRDAKKKRFI